MTALRRALSVIFIQFLYVYGSVNVCFPLCIHPGPLFRAAYQRAQKRFYIFIDVVRQDAPCAFA
jgi:hypothetical protein